LELAISNWQIKWKDVLALIREYEQGQDGMEMAPTPECEQKNPG
jgi:hypothetical protein